MIRFTHERLRRGGRTVLEPGEFELPAGSVCGLVGVNGAGKTTLLAALAGELHRRCGRVRTDGVERERVACTPQQPAFPDWLTVAGIAQLYGEDIDRIESAHPELRLDELRGKRAGSLSSGQRQALSIALALVMDAPLTLLDEPFAALDFRRRIGLMRLLQQRRNRAQGITLLSSQSAADLLDTCDWILVLREGRYVHSGAAASLTGGATDPGEARQRFESAIMTLLGAAPPVPAQG